MRLAGTQWKHALTQLSASLGPRQAKLELTWMLQSLEQRHNNAGGNIMDTLSASVARRASGEPLQYVLGGLKQSHA
jgi:hypothetical protein